MYQLIIIISDLSAILSVTLHYIYNYYMFHCCKNIRHICPFVQINTKVVVVIDAKICQSSFVINCTVKYLIGKQYINVKSKY